MTHHINIILQQPILLLFILFSPSTLPHSMIYPSYTHHHRQHTHHSHTSLLCGSLLAEAYFPTPGCEVLASASDRDCMAADPPMEGVEVSTAEASTAEASTAEASTADASATALVPLCDPVNGNWYGPGYGPAHGLVYGPAYGHVTGLDTKRRDSLGFFYSNLAELPVTAFPPVFRPPDAQEEEEEELPVSPEEPTSVLVKKLSAFSWTAKFYEFMLKFVNTETPRMVYDDDYFSLESVLVDNASIDEYLASVAEEEPVKVGRQVVKEALNLSDAEMKSLGRNGMSPRMFQYVDKVLEEHLKKTSRLRRRGSEKRRHRQQQAEIRREESRLRGMGKGRQGEVVGEEDICQVDEYGKQIKLILNKMNMEPGTMLLCAEDIEGHTYVLVSVVRYVCELSEVDPHIDMNDLAFSDESLFLNMRRVIFVANTETARRERKEFLTLRQQTRILMTIV
eukprot:GHVQ01010633.1.p1 GENE.GHVQ01010633.1~~GHVQ01010633.1.p1  ORF type:complete len:464 (-),score=84.02 GHVQ01010633.1:157-1512(-)